MAASHAFVIDASVVGRAGESGHPLTSYAQQFLREVLRDRPNVASHYVLVSLYALGEYRSVPDQTGFAKRWQQQILRVADRLVIPEPLVDYTISKQLEAAGFDSDDHPYVALALRVPRPPRHLVAVDSDYFESAVVQCLDSLGIRVLTVDEAVELALDP